MSKKGLFVKDILVIGDLGGKNGEIHANFKGKKGSNPVILNRGVLDNTRAQRIIDHIQSIAETAKNNHKKDRYTRAITDEFSFYTSNTPLTLNEYKHIINEISKNLKGFPPNIILVMSSMPVQWPDGTLRNAVLHIQSPKDNISDPIIHHFSKEKFSWVDPYYAKAFNQNDCLSFRPDNYQDPLYSPNVVLRGTKASCNDVNQYKSAILVEGTGLSPLINTVDVCLDHDHGVAMRNAKELIKQLPTPPLHVNHIVTSNSINEQNINLVASTIHADWYERKVLGSIEKKNESIPTHFGDLKNKSKAYIYRAKQVGLMHGDLFDMAAPKANTKQAICSRLDGDGNTLLHQILIQRGKSIQKESYFKERLNKLMPYFRGDTMNQKNNLGNTPLHLAIQKGVDDEKLMHFLLQGARLDIKNNLGITPIGLARQLGKVSLFNKFYQLLSYKRDVYFSHRNTILDLLKEVFEPEQKQKIALSALNFEIKEFNPKTETIIGLLQATQNNPAFIVAQISQLLLLASSQQNLYIYLTNNNLLQGISTQTVKRLPQAVKEKLLKNELATQNPSAERIALFLSSCDIPCIFTPSENEKLLSGLMQSQNVYNELSRLNYEKLIRDFAKSTPAHADKCIERIVNCPVYFESVVFEALAHCNNNLNMAPLKQKLRTIYPCCSDNKQKELFIQFPDSDKIHLINYWLTKNADYLNPIASPLARKIAFLDVINLEPVVNTIRHETLVCCMMNTQGNIVNWNPLRNINYTQLNYNLIYSQTLQLKSADEAYKNLAHLAQSGYPSVMIQGLYEQLKLDGKKQFLSKEGLISKSNLDKLFDPMHNLLQKIQTNQPISWQEYTDYRKKFLNSSSCANYLKDRQFSQWILLHERQTQGFPDSLELATSIFAQHPLLANQETNYKSFPMQCLPYLQPTNTEAYQAIRTSFPKKYTVHFSQFLNNSALSILFFENQLHKKNIDSSLLEGILSTFPLYDFKIKENYPNLLSTCIQIAKQNANQAMYDNLHLTQCPQADAVDSIIDFEKNRKNINVIVSLIQNYPQQFFNHPSLGDFLPEVMSFLADNVDSAKVHYPKIRTQALQQLTVLPEEIRQQILSCECSLGNNTNLQAIQEILKYLPSGELDVARKMHNNEPLSEEVFQWLLERTLTSIHSREIYELIRDKIDMHHSENARKITLQQNIAFNENRNSELIIAVLKENIAIIKQLDKNILSSLTADEITRSLEGIERIDLDIYGLIQDKLTPSSENMARLIINSEQSSKYPNMANIALACLYQPSIVSTLTPSLGYELLNQHMDLNGKTILIGAMGESNFEDVYTLSRNKDNREMLALLIENGGTGDNIQNKIKQLSTEDINSEPFIKLTQYKSNLTSYLAYRAIACNASDFISSVLKHGTIDNFLQYDDSLYDALSQNKDKPFLLKWILISFNKLLENQNQQNEIEFAPAALSQPLLSLLNTLNTLYHKRSCLFASQIERLLPVICTNQNACEAIQLAIQNSLELFTHENIQIIQENSQLQCDIKTAKTPEDIQKLFTKYKQGIDKVEKEHSQPALSNIEQKNLVIDHANQPSKPEAERHQEAQHKPIEEPNNQRHKVTKLKINQILDNLSRKISGIDQHHYQEAQIDKVEKEHSQPALSNIEQKNLVIDHANQPSKPEAERHQEAQHKPIEEPNNQRHEVTKLKINQILDNLSRKISGIDQHHYQEAQDVAQRLLNALQQAKNNYFRSLDNLDTDIKIAHKNFVQECRNLIHTASPILERDLNWSTYLSNLLKSIANTVMLVVSFGQVNSFFKLAQAESIKTVNDVKEQLGKDYTI